MRIRLKKIPRKTPWKTFLKSRGNRKQISMHIPFVVWKRANLLSIELGLTFTDIVVLALARYMANPTNFDLIEQSDYSDVDELDKIFDSYD